MSNQPQSPIKDTLPTLLAGGLRPENIHQEQDKLIVSALGMLRVRSANQVLKESAEQPDPILLFDQLVVQYEFTILFADTGIGKTIFAVQIGVHISKLGYVVLYIDLELSDKQFEKRYKDEFGKHYQFPENFYRADYTPMLEAPKGISYEEFFIQSLIASIDECGAQVVIIDNMTKLSSGDTDSAKNTIPVMEALFKMKREKGITLLVLEHNKKVDAGKPISLNDLQGSKFKSNFADAVFTIGRSCSDKNLRYVKQLKVRTAEQHYDTDNVATYEIKYKDRALQFDRLGFGSEYSYLQQDTQAIRSDKKQRASELKSQGLSNMAIAKELDCSEGAVRKWFKSKDS